MDNISEITDLATAKQWFTDHDVYVKYPLATPITVQLTPTQVEQMLENNIFAYTGDVEVTYNNYPTFNLTQQAIFQKGIYVNGILTI